MSLLRSLSGRVAASALFALTASSLAHAQTQAPITVFNDTLTGGSTQNDTGSLPAPSLNATAYQIISSQAYPTGTPTIGSPSSSQPGLRMGLDTTLLASGANFMTVSAQAIFSKYPVKLATANDYIEMTTTFTAETPLLTDSSAQTNANATFVFTGLFSTSVTTGTTTTDRTGANRDSTYSPEPTPALSFPLSDYVHQPTPAKAGGQTTVNTSNQLGNIFPAYWRGYTSRHYRTGGRSQAYAHVWAAPAGTPNVGVNAAALNPTNTSTLANLTQGQQYTAVVRITRQPRINANTPSAGFTNTTTQLVLVHSIYAGATATGTPLFTYNTTAVNSGSQHQGVVYDALAVGLRLNGNGTSGSTQIMAINSIKVETTGISVIAPLITTQPVAVSTSLGDPATFTVVANGGGDPGATLSYQWRKNGLNIAGATSSTYNIPSTAYTDAGDYSVVVTNTFTATSTVVGTVTSNNANLFVGPPAPPTIEDNPVAASAAAGNSASFTASARGNGITFQWQKSTDGGTTFTNIPGGNLFTNGAGARASTLTIASVQTSSAGLYRAVAVNSTASVASGSAALTVTYNTVGFTSSGYGSAATGGGSTTPVTVSTPAAFKTQAESTGPGVITVAGALTLTSKVSVKSDKTIQGIDGEATIIGNLEIGSGVSNVVVRGLNITNPAGSGLTITGATNVYVNHVSFYNCSDTLLAITAAADNVTVSWSEFYYTTFNAGNKAVLVGTTGETKPLSVTFDHNWWSDNIASQMPDTTYGRVHMYNNLFRTEAGTAMGNITGTMAHANAQLFSERNQYTSITDPLRKEGAAIGLVTTLGNTYTTTSGTAAYAGTDFISFAPPYSYQMSPTTALTADVSAAAGNLAGAATPTPAQVGTASINGTASSVPLGGSFELTAATGSLPVAPLTPVPPYQWRLNGLALTSQTTSKLTVGGADASNTGNYTVAVLLASGETIVSTPFTITTTSGSSSVPASQSEGAGGGGAPSLWFFGALGFLAALRRFFRR